MEEEEVAIYDDYEDFDHVDDNDNYDEVDDNLVDQSPPSAATSIWWLPCEVPGRRDKQGAVYGSFKGNNSQDDHLSKYW